MTIPIGSVWRKAALLGSVWAAVEVVLGSFLHNLRFPFAGSLLASLGVCILVAGVRIWDTPGLVWRAGLICALMKSVSPSAVIIGPMIGIVTEALLLEATIRFFRSHPVGLLLGGGIATAVPLIQKMLGLVIVYGIDAARLYVALYEYAVRGFGVEFFGPLDLVGALVVVSILLGIMMAFVGMTVARKALRLDREDARPPLVRLSIDFETVEPGQKYSIHALFGHVIALAAGFLAIAELPLWASLLPVATYAAATFLRYRKVARRFARPRLWIEFTLIAILAGLLLGGLTSPAAEWSWQGVVVGLRMTLRAALMIAAFSSISVELRNPEIIRWFLRKGLGRLQSALGVAFQALPRMMESFGKQSRFFLHPFDTLAHVLSSALQWVNRLDHEAEARRHTFVITGERGTGKTSFLLRLVTELQHSGWAAGGVLAPAVIRDGEPEGYDVRDIRTGLSVPLCRSGVPTTGIESGPYSFFPSGVAFGRNALDARMLVGMDVVCIDEIGPLEMRGEGWASATRELLRNLETPLLLVVRSSLLHRVSTFLDGGPKTYWDPSRTTDREALEQLSALLR
ncbi:MAG: nucleoside-triphosphatase [Bacteroidota bacterium]